MISLPNSNTDLKESSFTLEPLWVSLPDTVVIQHRQVHCPPGVSVLLRNNNLPRLQSGGHPYGNFLNDAKPNVPEHVSRSTSALCMALGLAAGSTGMVMGIQDIFAMGAYEVLKDEVEN